MLRIVRSLHMRREWFAGAAPIQCFCVICRGADVDRLHSDESDRRIGHNHNVVNLDSLYSSYVGLSASAPLLRGRMGFEGTVVSDYSSVEWLHTRQRIGESIADAGVRALCAGLDVELPSISGYGHNLVQAVQEGRLDEEVLDRAVLRVLTDKFAVGLFENPYPERDSAVINSVAGEGNELSRRLAQESITLLKNDSTLPLRPGIRVAVVGPNAEVAIVNFAAYTQPAQVDMMKGMATGQSRMAGLSSMMDSASEPTGAMADQIARLASLDSEEIARTEYGATSLADAIGEFADVTAATGVGIHPDDPRDIGAAVAAAGDADAVVLSLGGRAGWFGTRITEGEGTDIAHLELPEGQVELVRAMAETGKPLIAVLHQGRPLAITEVEPYLHAILVAPYPGPHGSAAAASVIFGEVNPSGHLPHSMPRATGQVPLYAAQHHGSGYRRGDADMFRNYIDLELSPLYPFGHGLSYTQFVYGDLTVDVERTPADGGRFVASVDVSNTGGRAGAEVVQLYASVKASAVTRPAFQLVGFRRVELEPGVQATVSFAVETSQLGYSDVDGAFVLEPGPLELTAGGSSDALSSPVHIQLEGKTAKLDGRRTFLSTSTIRPHALI
ncbi:MAG: glycoside hydrolase family 3 C-terminal domain-containing protein [Acidobacteriota bacterium]|nr:glycoside hydrolase family 3 C-terminal domain-containing protein [Acidobacteriota bacterium]